MGVSENIIKLRRLTGVTQQELADIAGVSRSAVSLWEIGDSKPRMGAIQSLADHFGIRKANIIEDGGMDDVVMSATGRLYSVEYNSGVLSEDEQRLLSLYRSCSPTGKVYVMQVAETTAALMPVEGSHAT